MAATVVFAAVGMWAEWISPAAWRWSDVAVGVVLAVSGAVVVDAHRREPGLALMATSVAWFLGTARPTAMTLALHRPMLVTALVLFALPATATPRARVVSWGFTTLVWTAWLIMRPPVAGPAVGLFILSIGLVNSLLVRRQRHLVHAAPWIPFLLWTLVLVPLATRGPAIAWYEVAVAATGVLCAVVARARRPRPERLLAVDLGLVAPGRAGDVRLRLLGPAEPFTPSSRCSLVSLDGGHRLAVEHPADTVLTPPLVADLRRTGRLLAEHRELGETLQRRTIEVAESRERLAIATARERERFEHDLRSNVAPHLDRLGLVLASSSPAAMQVVDELRREVDALCASDEPAAFEGDLTSALHALARTSPVPVRLEVQPVSCSPQVARTVWFVVAESLANAIRHAGASRVEVSLRPAAGGVELRVLDDGVGGADPSLGTGVRGLEGRARAVGGVLSVESPAGGGTAVRFTAPQ